MGLRNALRYGIRQFLIAPIAAVFFFLTLTILIPAPGTIEALLLNPLVALGYYFVIYITLYLVSLWAWRPETEEVRAAS